MAQLSTGQTQLQQIKRRRALASALQQQSLSTAPIRHVNQGLAQLAQAFAARKINKDADKKEGEVTKEQARLLAEMLGPNVSYEQGPGTPAAQHTLPGDPEALKQLMAGEGDPLASAGITNRQLNEYDELTLRASQGDQEAIAQLESGSGDPAAGIQNRQINEYEQLMRDSQDSTFEIAAIPGKRERVETEKTPNQLLEAMMKYRPEMATAIMGNVLQGRLSQQYAPPEKEATTGNITEWRQAKEDGYSGGLQDWIDRNQNLGNSRGTDGAPSGWKWNVDGGLIPIEGGPADPKYLASIARNTPEAATKATLVDRARFAASELTKIIYETDENGVIKTGKDGEPLIHARNVANMFAKTPWTVGRTGNVLLKEAIEAKLRAESGAAVPTTEVERAAERFQPLPIDSPSTIRLKQRLLSQFLDDAYNRMNKDGRFDIRGTINAALDDAAAQGITGKTDGIKLGDIRYDSNGNAMIIEAGPNGLPTWMPYEGPQ